MPDFMVDRLGRLEFFGLPIDATPRRKELLRAFELHISAAVRDFYDKVEATPDAARHFASRAAMEHAAEKQLAHWRALFSSELDDEFVKRATRVGRIHAQVGLDTSLYFGAYAQILAALVGRIVSECDAREACGPQDLTETISTLIKVALLDMDIAITTIFSVKERDRDEVISTVGQALRRFARGDISQGISGLPAGYEEIGTDFNATIKTVGEVLYSVTRTADGIGLKSGALDEALQALAERTVQQAQSLEDTAESINELAGAVQDTANSAAHVNGMVAGVHAAAAASSRVMREAIDAMSEIERSSSTIAEIVAVIEGFAKQSGLLALNARIEAARAGDAGQGFAVVANEVRNLAKGSAAAASDIRQLAAESSQQVAAGVRRVNQAAAELETIVASFSEASRLIQSIAAAAEQQAGSIQNVNQVAAEIERITHSNAEMVDRSTKAVQRLASEADYLSELVAHVQFGDWEFAKIGAK